MEKYSEEAIDFFLKNDAEAWFYYSEKQNEISKLLAKDGLDSLVETYALIENKVVQYTQIVPDDEESLFDDAVCLGKGVIHSFNVIKDVPDSITSNYMKNPNSEANLANLNLLIDYKSGRIPYEEVWPDIIGNDEDEED